MLNVQVLIYGEVERRDTSALRQDETGLQLTLKTCKREGLLVRFFVPLWVSFTSLYWLGARVES